MALIPDSRANLHQEEADYRSALSEAFFTKLGGITNFINNRQVSTFNFNLNGLYANAAGQTGLEGFLIFRYDFEIVSIGLSNAVAGSSGSTSIDVHLIRGSGNDLGSIFSVKPAIDSTAPADAYGLREYIPSVSDVVTGTGITLPSLTTNLFNAGDAFRFDVDTTMLSAENFSLSIIYRPR